MIRWAPLLAVFGCLQEPDRQPLLSIELAHYQMSSPGRYQLVASVGNFDPLRGIAIEIVVGRDDGKQPDQLYPLGQVGGARGELIVDLDPEVDYHARARAVPRDGYDPTAEDRWRTAPWVVPGDLPIDPELPIEPPLPPIDGISPDLSDGGTVRVTARGMENAGHPSMFIRFRPVAGAGELVRELQGTRCDQGGCLGVLVPMMSPTVWPPMFTSALPKATVFYDRPGYGLVNGGTTHLRYRMSAPSPDHGAPGDELAVELYHPSRAPGLEGLTVLFDDTPMRPIAAEDHAHTLLVWPAFATRSSYRVPANAAPGVHHIRARTQVGDEFLSSDDTFVVVDVP